MSIVLEARKSLRIETKPYLTVNMPNSLTHLKPSPSNLTRKMSQNKTPDIFISLPRSNIFMKSTTSPSLAHIPQRNSFCHSTDARHPKYQSLNSLPKICVTSSSRTDLDKCSNFLKPEAPVQSQRRFLPCGMFSSPDKIKDECEARYGVARKSICELSTMEILNQETLHSHTSKEVKIDIEKAIKNADKVLGAMGIEVMTYNFPVSDSSMKIYPITEEYRLANFYKMFIPEMCRFNYVFLSNLRIGRVAVCEAVRIADKKYAAILDQKLHNGLFVLEKMSNKKKVQKHWFRVIMYHFLKAVPDFYADWKDMISNGSQQDIKSPLKELVKTFRRLVGAKKDDWKENPELRRRVKVLREALKEFNLTSTEVVELEDD